MRIVFLGTADFGIPALQAIQKRHTLAGVVSTPAKPAGRGRTLSDSPIVTFAKRLNISPILTPERLDDPALPEELRKLAADCFVVVAFRLLPRAVFTIPRLCTLNIHASLLPAYRGPAPIHRAIEAGEKKSGVTVFRIDDGVDTGEILHQVATSIGPQETTPELYSRLSALGAETLEYTLEKLELGTLQPYRQEHERASKAPKLKKEEARINWELPAGIICNKIRAFKPFPGTVTFLDGKRLGIEWAHPEGAAVSEVPCGTIITIHDDSFDVQTGGGVLRVLAVKPEGRKNMTARDFLNGSSLREGQRFDE